MKHTDKFFLFPVKVYNDEATLDNMEENNEWVLGYARLPLEDCYIITWFDTFTKGRDLKEVVDKGCDLTRVVSERFGAYICLWSRKKFENKLNDYIEKLEKDIDESRVSITIDNIRED